MITRYDVLNEYVRLNQLYRDVYIEFYEEGSGCMIVIYCSVKPSDDLYVFKELDRLIIFAGRLKHELLYEDIFIGNVAFNNYPKYKFIIPVGRNFRIEDYKIDNKAIIIKLKYL